MKADNFDLNGYFERIGYHGNARPDIRCVGEIMRRHLYTVPFENLDVLAGKGISLKPEDIVDKIVHRQRGGYCFEVNGLFAMALEALGIPYRFIGCRPMTIPARRPRTHMALLAMLDGDEWLCDVGFGSYGIRAPMRLAQRGEVRQDHDTFEILPMNEAEFILRAKVDGDWANQYSFDLAHHEWVDFMPANWLTSTYPDSLFVQKRVVIRQTPEGRSILFGDRLKIVNHGQAEAREIAKEEIPAVLREVFGLEAVD